MPIGPAMRRLAAAALAVASAAAALNAQPAGAAPAARPAVRAPASPGTGPGHPALGTRWSPGSGRTTANSRTGAVPGRLLVTLDGSTSLTGRTVGGAAPAARTPRTSSAALNSRLHALGASSFTPLFPHLPAATAQSLTGAARSRLAGAAVDLSRTFVVKVADHDSARAARRLAGAPGVANVEPQRYVTAMNTGAQRLTTTPAAAGRHRAAAGEPAPAQGSPALPANYGLVSSAQAHLNAGGTDAVGAFTLLGGSHHQLPGQGETITNVSVGDLTDQSMADAGDGYVRAHGPTTVLEDGHRYLDLPSMPLIPTYVAGPDATLDPAGSTEEQDPALGEVMLDFGVMAPLPHDRQRPGRTGQGYTDLLGIAPGADYRLVVPQRPTNDAIAAALLAAATQRPRPDVITASLGFGTDDEGFPSRYLEDDPVNRAVIAAIVQRYHVVVCVSSNDGTRLATPASVGPDGGSTPTDTARGPSSATTLDDDFFSTTPTRVPDSGAIAAGGTTLDDTLSVPADSHRSPAGPLAETRVSGSGTFSSGFGSRVDLSAPSDNILAFEHPQGAGPQDVQPVLSGGTSASAPEIAAAAAVALQAGRLGGHRLSPAAVRSLLERTGRPVATPPQIDRALHVGPQIDVTAAATEALGGPAGHYRIDRLSVAHRVTMGGLGGTFLEDTDQHRIDLGDRAQGGTGEGLVGPVTFSADVTAPAGGPRPDYVLAVGARRFHSPVPAVRVTPAQLLSAAGLPVVSSTDRAVHVTFQVRVDGGVRAEAGRTMTIGPSDGTHVEATAPVVDPVVTAGWPVTVRYDLTGVPGTQDPMLVLSTVGHWNPVLGPVFTAARTVPLTATSGTVTLPADAFTGGGLYGIGIAQTTGGDADLTYSTFGEFAPVRVDGGTPAARPAAPLVTAGGAYGHTAHVTAAEPGFTVRYDVRAVHGASGAVVEVSAPGRTVFGSFNTFTNANGTTYDQDGVNTPSTVRRRVSGRSGTVRLDAVALGLPTSMSYNVRVLATGRDGALTGQASPSSQLAVDDGPAPGGSTVTDFAVAGADSVAVLRTAAGGTQVRRYSPGSGAYGTILAEDTITGSAYQVYGVAPRLHRTLLAHTASSGATLLETRDTRTGALIGSTTEDPVAYEVVTGRVDAVRARGAVLLHAAAGGDVLLPVDLATGAAGTPLPADPEGVRAGSYEMLDIDASTGDAYLSARMPGPICLKATALARADLDTGTVTASQPLSGCGTALASDQAGSLYWLGARSVSASIEPTTFVTPLDGRSMEPAEQVTVRRGVGTALAVDGTHHLALIAFPTPAGTAKFGFPNGIVTDNNATSQITVVDLSTGLPLRTMTGFDFPSPASAPQRPSLQLDPATRTGWASTPSGNQIHRFSY
jgi:Subtilase family